MTRGALALAVVGAMYQIHDQGAAHAAYADLGAVADGLFNKIHVAEHYTLNARNSDPSSSVLEGVTSDDATLTAAIEAIDSATVVGPRGVDYILTKGRDNIQAGEGDDSFLADADDDGFATLNGFDTIDGGAGYDIMTVYDIDTDLTEGDAEFDAQVSNVERLDIYTRGGIMADVSNWEGLEHVELGRFDRAGNVSLTVDGATVSTSRKFGGSVTIVGADGEVNVEAGSSSAVRIGSGAHSTSATVKGGSSVDVNATGAGGQSMTVTSVYLDGVKGEGLGGDGARGNPMEGVNVTVAADNASLTPSATVTQYGTSDGSGYVAVPDSADNPTTTYYIAAVQDANGDTDGTGLTEGQVLVTTVEADAEMREQVFVGGERVAPGTADAVSGVDSGGVPIHINSDAIEHVSLSNTYATIAVINKSDDAEDLMITVNKYGGKIAGKFCITGDGAAENVSIMVAGDSNFDLANNATKTVSISGTGDLTLGATNFVGPPANVNAGGDVTPAASATLESIMNSSSGKLTMDVAGMGKLESIDGSASSGGSSIKGIGDSVETVDGGSGGDAITVAAFADDGLTANLGAGNDTFSSAGGNTKSRVDGGEGTDVLHLTGASATHKVDGKDVSIFSNFEALEVGGSAAAAHDINLLGVHAVSASGTTLGAVTLNNVGDGMGISVNGRAGMGTMATIVHNMKDRSAGDARYSGMLDVTLTANGSKTDTAMNGTGTASLTLTADEEIETLNIASNANPSGKAGMATYQNSLTVMGAHAGEAGSETAVESSVEAIVVSGSARAMVSLATSTVGTAGTVAQFMELELIDASDNTGGVTFSAAAVDVNGTPGTLTQELEMVGGSGKDMFTGGDAADEIMGGGGNDTLDGGGEADELTGGAGADTLTGGAGDNMFKYSSASESQIVFSDKGPSGFDTITDWATGGTNVISLGRTIFNGLNAGTLREITGGAGVDSTNDAADTASASLQAFLGDGDGVFETRTDVTDGIGQTVAKNPVTTVTEAYYRAPVTGETADVDTDGDGEVDSIEAARTWVLIDVDGDGDFDATVDMVIALTGTVDLADGNFSAITLSH